MQHYRQTKANVLTGPIGNSMKKILFILIFLLLFNVLNTIECYSQKESIAYDVDKSTDYDEGLTLGEDLNISANATINLNGGVFIFADDVKVYGTAKLKIKNGADVYIADGIGLYAEGKTSSIESGTSVYVGGSVFVGDENVSHAFQIEAGKIVGEIWVYKDSMVEITGHDFNYDFGLIHHIDEIWEDWGDVPVWDEESGTTIYVKSGVTIYTETDRNGTLTGVVGGSSISWPFHIMKNGNANIELIDDGE